ncbi:MAG: hypothetical protein ACJASQ_000649 [Crocinitomicaceae bacterium]|jgi:hypothetical protein
MNRIVNALLIFVLLLTAFISIYVGFDMPITFLRCTGEYLPYKFEIFLGLGLFVFIIVLRKAIRRWMGIRIVSRTKKFKWTQPVSLKRKKRVVTYLSLETAVMIFAGVVLYKLTPHAIFPAAAYLIGAFDNLMMILVKASYRVGLSSKALIVADREVIVLYFTGLRKVSIHQQTVYFDYIKDLQLTFPLDCIQEESQEEFFEALEAQLDRDKVFFSKVASTNSETVEKVRAGL